MSSHQNTGTFLKTPLLDFLCVWRLCTRPQFAFLRELCVLYGEIIYAAFFLSSLTLNSSFHRSVPSVASHQSSSEPVSVR